MKTLSESFEIAAEDLDGLSDDVRKSLELEASRHLDATPEQVLSGILNNFLFSIRQAKTEADLKQAQVMVKAFFSASDGVKSQIAKLLSVDVPEEAAAAVTAS